MKPLHVLTATEVLESREERLVLLSLIVVAVRQLVVEVALDDFGTESGFRLSSNVLTRNILSPFFFFRHNGPVIFGDTRT